MAVISIEHVSKTFETKDGKVEALKDINLQIEAGAIFGIIGLSGAGKSTLVRCMNYLEKPDSGRVLLQGRDLGEMSVQELRKQRQKIGMIFQHFNLLMQKDVLANVCFPLSIQGVPKKQARERARELLAIVGLQDREHAYPAQLSGGQKQRVAIARALAAGPEILLCDEATSALDPQTTASILSLLQEINQKMQITIVMITHQMSVVRQIGTEVAILENGQLIEQGAVSEIFAHPKSAIAKKLILQETGNGFNSSNSLEQGELHSGTCLRIVFSENSALEPVIANMILKFQEPVNILKANLKEVSGVAKGEMLLGLAKESRQVEEIKAYLTGCGLEVEEVNAHVDA